MRKLKVCYVLGWYDYAKIDFHQVIFISNSHTRKVFIQNGNCDIRDMQWTYRGLDLLYTCYSVWYPQTLRSPMRVDPRCVTAWLSRQGCTNMRLRGCKWRACKRKPQEYGKRSTPSVSIDLFTQAPLTHMTTDTTVNVTMRDKRVLRGTIFSQIP